MLIYEACMSIFAYIKWGFYVEYGPQIMLDFGRLAYLNFLKYFV